MAEESTNLKGSDVVDGVEKFFLDLVGTIVPGCVLLTLSWFLFTTGYNVDWKSLPFFPDKSPWVFILGISYVLGQGMASFGEFFLVRILDWVLGIARKVKILRTLLGRSLAPQRDMFTEIEADPIFAAFVEICRSLIPALATPSKTSLPVLTWRSLAMSFAPSQRQTVYRFMFLSLLNLGVGTSLAFAAVGTVSIWLCHLNQILPSVLAPPLWVAFVLLIAAFFFFERRYYFNRISTTIPFGMAVAELSQSQTTKSETSIGKLATDFKPKSIYLAGGFHSGWQQKVVGAISTVQFKDPRTHGLKDKLAYTLWDLEAIRDCDLVFAYLEASNPGGYALALEVGFANALGKRIIFVNEKHAPDTPENRALHMVEAAADVTFKSFEEGLVMLKKICDA
jgi:hypothetical protein